MASRSSSNPISISPGPDLHIRTFLHRAFARHAQKGHSFDLDNWSKWSKQEVAQSIRALARDYLEMHGSGHDWVTASFQAEIVMAATYHVVAYEADIQPAPRMHLNFFDSSMGEGFELVMEPPLELKVDPIPGAPAAQDQKDQSHRVRAKMMIQPTGNCLDASDECLWTGANQLRDFFETHSRLPLVMMGACLTVWKGFQVSHLIRGGAIYRGIRNMDKPDIPAGEMRLVYSRTGQHLVDAVEADPESAAFLLRG